MTEKDEKTESNEIIDNGSKKIVTHTPDGNFAPGNPGGPGRPPKKKEEKYHLATIESVTLEDWREIVTKAMQQAKQGNRYARDWLGNYILGRPKQRADDDVLDRVIQVVYVDNWRDDAS